MIPECTGCPFALWPTWCHAAATGHRRYCDLARTRLDYHAIIEARTLDRPLIQVQAPPSTPPTAQQTAAALATLAQIKLVKKCEHRTDPLDGCQAGCATCVRPDRPGKVTMRDCLACLNASPD